MNLFWMNLIHASRGWTQPINLFDWVLFAILRLQPEWIRQLKEHRSENRSAASEQWPIDSYRFRIVWSCSKLFDVRFSQSLITAKKSALFVFRTDFNLHFLSLSLATFASGCKTFKAYGFRNSQKLLEEFRNFPFKLLNSFESKSDTIARSSCCTEAAHIQILCQEAPVQKLHTEAPYRQLDRYWFWNLEVQSKLSNSTFEADKDSEWRALSMKSLSSATRSGFRVSDLWGKRIC